jgi:hypothetical protein
MVVMCSNNVPFLCLLIRDRLSVETNSQDRVKPVTVEQVFMFHIILVLQSSTK